MNFFGPRDGLVHISQLSNERTSQVTDVVNENDDVFVKLIGFDDRGKSKLTMKGINQESGLEENEASESNSKPEKINKDEKRKTKKYLYSLDSIFVIVNSFILQHLRSWC